MKTILKSALIAAGLAFGAAAASAPALADTRHDNRYDQRHDNHRDGDRNHRGDRHDNNKRHHADRHDRHHDNDWARYNRSNRGHVPWTRHAYNGYGAQWMWWGGSYHPRHAPAAYRNCYPAVRNGYYHGRRARLGGTMCNRGHSPYLLPNSTFVIALF
jgi:hypothetical protein